MLFRPRHALAQQVMLDADRNARGDRAKQVAVLDRELVRTRRPHVSDAQELVILHERHAVEREDASLLDHGALHEWIFERSLERERLARLGDRTGEALADRERESAG